MLREDLRHAGSLGVRPFHGGGFTARVAFPVKPRTGFSSLRDLRVVGLSVGCLLAGFLAGLLLFGRPWHLTPDFGDVPTLLLVLLAAVAG